MKNKNEPSKSCLKNHLKIRYDGIALESFCVDAYMPQNIMVSIKTTI